MSEKDISEINIIYDIKEENKIRIFGSKFVEKNRNLCKMIINNKEYKIERRYYIKNYNHNILKLKLKGFNNITDMSYIFNECSSLSSLPDISKLNTDNVIDMCGMFNGCSSLTSLPDISKWNTNKVISMSYIFNGCSSLSSLPDISKWNIDNINIIYNTFS